MIKVLLLGEHFYRLVPSTNRPKLATATEGGVPSKVAVWVSERVDEFDLDACKANTDHHIQETTVTAMFPKTISLLLSLFPMNILLREFKLNSNKVFQTSCLFVHPWLHVNYYCMQGEH